MKNVYTIVAALALVLTASCNRALEFEHETFATFSTSSYSVDENIGEVKVPVTIFNPTGSDIQLSVKIIEGSAVADDDYQVMSSNLMTFAAGETTKDFVIAVTDKSGEFTGSKDFNLQLESLTDNVSVGAFNTVKFTIKDLDHPLAMFIGEWSGQIGSYFDGGDIPMTFVIKSNDEDATYSSVIIEDFDPSLVSYGYTAATGCNIYKATVNENRDKLVISKGQPTGVPGYVLVGFDSTSITTASGYEDIVINLVDGKLVIPKGWGSTDLGGYWGGIYDGPAEFTK